MKAANLTPAQEATATELFGSAKTSKPAATNRIAEAIEAPQFFTPILRANMAKLMEANGDRAQIAKQIACVFVACENIADFAAHDHPSPRHMAAWIKELIDSAKAIRVVVAHMEEAEARASVADQIDHEICKAHGIQRSKCICHGLPAGQYAKLPGESAFREPANASLATDEELQAEQDLLSPEERAVLAQLSADPTHAQRATLYNRQPEPNTILSSVTLVKYLGTEHADEAGAEILKRAADHIYNRLPEPRTFETADAGDAQAIDQMDELRGFEDGDGDPDPDEE